MPNDPSKQNDSSTLSPPDKGSQHSERRSAPRFPFVAEAEVTELSSEARLSARISELSLGGCYVDTLNPFPQQTFVQLRLIQGKEIFETRARVIYFHPGIGMGLAFAELTADQKSVLVGWLAKQGEQT